MNQKPIAQCRPVPVKRSRIPKVERKAPKRYKVTPPKDERFIETHAKSDKKRWQLWVYGGGRNPILDGWKREETTWEKRFREKQKTGKLKT